MKKHKKPLTTPEKLGEAGQEEFNNLPSSEVRELYESLFNTVPTQRIQLPSVKLSSVFTLIHWIELREEGYFLTQVELHYEAMAPKKIQDSPIAEIQQSLTDLEDRLGVVFGSKKWEVYTKKVLRTSKMDSKRMESCRKLHLVRTFYNKGPMDISHAQQLMEAVHKVLADWRKT